MIERLMILDAVVADRHYTWLGTERDKHAYFTLMLRTGLQRDQYPHITFGEGPEKIIRCFPDKLPIGVEKNGFRRHVFLYLVTRNVPVEFRMFLLRHAELLRSTAEWTIRLLIPRRFRKAAALYRYAARDELAMPLEPSTVEQLERYFPERQRTAGALSEPADEDLAKAFRKFGAARFQALYRMWQRQGDPALWAAGSYVLRDALARGEGRVECVELTHQYLQLTSLVGVA